MTDLNNSGMSDLGDINEVLKDGNLSTSQKEFELGKIRSMFGKGGFIKIDKFIEITSETIQEFVIASQSINEVKDAVVTQGTATGTLMVALSGDVTEIKVKQNDDSPVEFNDTDDLLIGSTTVVGNDIISAEYLKVYYGICRNKIKQSRYKNFKKKDDSGIDFQNAFVDRVLDYYDLILEASPSSEGPLDSKEKLQKMVDLTNSKTTTSDNEKKFAGKDKDIHITIDSATDSTDTMFQGPANKSYKIGNFSGWTNSGGTVSYDTNKVGAGNKPQGVTTNDWTNSKKEKTMYWKKNTAASGSTSNAGVYRKNKKKQWQTADANWQGIGRHKKKLVDTINQTELDDVKDNVDANSPIIEVGETDNTTDGAYVLFKLKKKPKNATEIQ